MTTVYLPRDPSCDVTADTTSKVPYEMLVPPLDYSAILEPERIAISEQEGRRYVEWVRDIEPARLPYARSVLMAAGAPIDNQEGGRNREELLALGRWIVNWASFLFNAGALDAVTAPRAEGPAISSGTVEPQAVALSLAHDLAFLVVDVARQSIPNLDWYVSHQTGERVPGLPGGYVRYYRPAVRPGLPGVLPITMSLQALNRIAVGWRPPVELEGGIFLASPSKTAWQSSVESSLANIYDNLFMDPLVTEAVRRRVGKRVWPFPQRPFRRLLKASAHSIPDPWVVAAAKDLRAAGWFGWFEGSDVELAGSLENTWRERNEWELDFTEYPGDLDQCLVAMDDARSLYESARPDADEVNHVYRVLVPHLARLTQVAVTKVREEWSSDLSEVRISFNLDSVRRAFTLPDCNRYVSPDLITRFDALIPNKGRRIWFPEHPMDENLIVTAATESERSELQNRRPLILLPTPPDWWRELGGPVPHEL